jgi:hypothetical protein
MLSGGVQLHPLMEDGSDAHESTIPKFCMEDDFADFADFQSAAAAPSAS